MNSLGVALPMERAGPTGESHSESGLSLGVGVPVLGGGGVLGRSDDIDQRPLTTVGWCGKVRSVVWLAGLVSRFLLGF